MVNKQILIKEIVETFDIEIISHGKDYDKKVISAPGLSHVGLGLASDICVKKAKNIIVFGMGEKQFLYSLDKQQLSLAIKRIIKIDPPLLLLTSSFNDEDIKFILQYLKDTNLLIGKTKENSNDLYLNISPYIAKMMRSEKTIHGTLINIYGTGVLLTGDSGIGKSELALDLVRNGHLFVGDDAINVYRFGDQIYGYANSVAKRFIEVRGVGILSIDQMFGVEKVLDQSSIDIVINLQKIEKIMAEIDRIREAQQYTKIYGKKIAQYTLPISSGRNLNNLVETAVIDYKMRLNGFNSAKEYLKNFDQIVKGKDKNAE